MSVDPCCRLNRGRLNRVLLYNDNFMNASLKIAIYKGLLHDVYDIYAESCLLLMSSRTVCMFLILKLTIEAESTLCTCECRLNINTKMLSLLYMSRTLQSA